VSLFIRRVKEVNPSWVWWYIHLIPALGRLRQGNGEFDDSLYYRARPCLKKMKEKKVAPEVGKAWRWHFFSCLN
jgi:hypothetical protein